MSNKKYILIGKILKPHALKGAFKFKPSGIGNEFFEYTSRVFLKNNDRFIEFNIDKISKFKKIFIIKFKEIHSIDDIELYKNFELFMLREEISLEEGEIFLDDLIGFTATFNNDEIGHILNFQNYGAGLIYVIKAPNKEVLIPDIDDFVEKIDFENKKIIFKDIEELL